MSKLTPMPRLFLAAFLAAVSFYLAGAAAAGADTLLRFKFKEGEKLDYECRQNMNSSMVIEGKTMSSKVQSTIMLSQQVKSVDADGNAALAVTITRVKMSMTMPMGPPLEYDSAEEKPQEGMGKMMADQFGEMLNKPYEMKIDPQGKVSELEMPEGMKEGRKGAGPMFGSDKMKQMLGGIAFPEEAVAAGETWTATTKMPTVPVMGEGVFEQTYKYTGPESKDGADLEKIELTAVINMKNNEKAPVKMELKDQQTKGDILFDNKAGRLQSSKSTSKMTFEMEMMGQTMTNAVETDIEMKLMPGGGPKTP